MSGDVEKRPREPSRVVFVGNIPFDRSEADMIELFSSAGKVLNFHMVYDSATGRTCGYGFAKYPDIDSASSAVRNLNEYPLSGRKIKVDFSSERPHHNGSEQNFDHMPAVPSGGSNLGGSLPPLPQGKELMAGLTCTDAVSRTLAALPPAQLLDILTQLKSLAATDPSRAAELLTQAPQLSYAVFQALLIMGLVSPEAIHSVIDPGTAPVVGPPQTLPVVGSNNTPPVAAASYAPVQSSQSTQPVHHAPPASDTDTDALMRQVMELPQAMIDALPDAERQQILALRNSFATAQGR